MKGNVEENSSHVSSTLLIHQNLSETFLSVFSSNINTCMGLQYGTEQHPWCFTCEILAKLALNQAVMTTGALLGKWVLVLISRSIVYNCDLFKTSHLEVPFKEAPFQFGVKS